MGSAAMVSPAIAQDALNRQRQHTNNQLHHVHPSAATSVHARRSEHPAAKHAFPRQMESDRRRAGISPPSGDIDAPMRKVVQFEEDIKAAYTSQAAQGVVGRAANFGKHKFPLSQPYSKLLNLS